MGRVASVFCAGLLCVAASVSSSAQSQAQAAAVRPQPVRPPVTVQSSVSRTAVWVGDPIAYIIEITCLAGTDILVEDLARDRLQLQGLEISSAEIGRETRADGAVVHRARFELAGYGTDVAALRIEPMRIRFYSRQASERMENLMPAGEVEVPAVEIALRSTLPDAGAVSIRAVRTLVLLPAFAGLLYPAGLALVVLSFAPVVVGIAAVVARRRAKAQSRRSKRRRPDHYRTALDELRQLDGTTDTAARRQAFDRLDHLLREYLTDLHIPAASLTPEEIDARVNPSLGGISPGAIAQVLRECQRAQYGGPDQLPSGDALTRAFEQTEEMLGSAGSHPQ